MRSVRGDVTSAPPTPTDDQADGCAGPSPVQSTDHDSQPRSEELLWNPIRRYGDVNRQLPAARLPDHRRELIPEFGTPSPGPSTCSTQDRSGPGTRGPSSPPICSCSSDGESP